jgi:hypothetical protein
MMRYKNIIAIAVVCAVVAPAVANTSPWTVCEVAITPGAAITVPNTATVTCTSTGESCTRAEYGGTSAQGISYTCKDT